jgi:hypothetical protein
MQRTDSLYARTLPHVKAILEAKFPNCEYKLTDELYRGSQAEFLDRRLGIDGFLISQATGIKWTFQTKVREARYLKYRTFRGQDGPDLTVEYMNNAGLPNEYPGEMFYLAAQYYFVGWERENKQGIGRWVILNIPTYKYIIERKGGLGNIGRLMQNEEFGRASFYTFPLALVDPAIVAHSGRAEWW